jgi:hypothetical protein
MNILPDLDGSEVDAHTDGLAWKKACSMCAYRTSDPQDLGDAYQRHLRKYDGTAVFYCIHRDDDYMVRICACYAAINNLSRKKTNESNSN